jgi:hypothetical protein
MLMTHKRISKSSLRLCILGQGAVGKTLAAWLKKHSGAGFKVKSLSWRRDLRRGSNTSEIYRLGSSADVIFFATRDSDSLKALKILEGRPVKKISLSASLQHAEVEILHPLMTFHPDSLGSLSDWSLIPIVGSLSPKVFKMEWTFLKNPYCYLPKSQFPLYHAQIVSGFSIASEVWCEVADFLRANKIPKSILKPLLHQWVLNLARVKNPLTGPLARKEFKILESHILKLASHAATPRQRWRVRCLEGLREISC